MSESTLKEFVEVAHGIVWCTVATVDRRGRPRSRVLHPVWRMQPDGTLAGLVATRPTPLKRAHLAHGRFVSCSYWHPEHDVAVAECAAAWLPEAEHARVWDAIASAPAPVGYDPGHIWPDGPHGADFAALRLEPWRVTVRRAGDFATGVPARVWRKDAGAAT
jgi:hypothetical protein